MPLSYRKIRTRHASIHLADTGGSGFPLVLIHGSGSSGAAFAPQLESPLADRYRLIALDLPGHGQSSDADDPASAYTLHGLAETVSDVVAALGIERAAFLGWSLGGHICIELLSFDGAVAGLMLSGTPPVGLGTLGMLRGFQTHWDLLLASKENFSERDVRRFHALMFDAHGDAAMFNAVKRADGRLRTIMAKSMMRGDIADQKLTVERARVPIAMVNGAREPFARLGYIAGLNYRTLWDHTCHVIPDAGHVPFRERPDLFNALLARFVDDIAAPNMAEPAPLARSA